MLKPRMISRPYFEICVLFTKLALREFAIVSCLMLCMCLNPGNDCMPFVKTILFNNTFTV